MRHSRGCTGFTLIELMIVLVVAGLVLSFGIPAFGHYRNTLMLRQVNAQILQDTAAHLPADAFMVETDCPYLAPVPHRGKRCEPAYTRLVAERVANLRGESIEGLAARTTQTAESFFQFAR